MTGDEQLERIRDILRPVLGAEPRPRFVKGDPGNLCDFCHAYQRSQVDAFAPVVHYVRKNYYCEKCLPHDWQSQTGTRDVVDGLSVEDAVRRVVEMVQHMPTNQDLLDAAVDAQARTDKYAKMMLKLVAERDAARAAVEWQPIETAPKDGTYVIAWAQEPMAREPIDCMDFMYFEDGQWCSGGRINSPEHQPTQWVPLPAPPSNEEPKR